MKVKCRVVVLVYCTSLFITMVVVQDTTALKETGRHVRHARQKKHSLLTFQRAKRLCNQDGQSLPSVTSIADEGALRHQLSSSGRDETWLDLKRINLGMWTWVDNMTSDVFPSTSQPRCGFLDYSTPYLRFSSCSQLWLGYLCQTEASAGCLDFQVGLKQVEAGGNCYTVHMEKVNWFEARHRCVSRGHDLALVKSADTADTLRDKLRRYWQIFMQQQFWIGIRNYEWAHRGGYAGGSVQPSFWAHTEPSDTGHCVRAVKSGSLYVWKATPCHQKHPFICVAPATEKVQTTTMQSTVGSAKLKHTTDNELTGRANSSSLNSPMSSHGSSKVTPRMAIPLLMFNILVEW